MYRILLEKPHRHYEDRPDAKRIEIFDWIHTFIHKEGDGPKDMLWVISEAQTGTSISFGSTRKAALARAKEILEHVGEEKTKATIKSLTQNDA